MDTKVAFVLGMKPAVVAAALGVAGCAGLSCAVVSGLSGYDVVDCPAAAACADVDVSAGDASSDTGSTNANDAPATADVVGDTRAADVVEVTTGWTKKRKLSIDNSTGTALTSLPVLVSLDASRISYASTKAGGADLRFTDATGSVLAYEIEQWTPSGTGASLVWIAVPTVAANAVTDVWMFYGNPTAPDAQNSPAVWDASYVGVWHLADAHDSTNKHTSTNNGGAAIMHGAANPAMKFAGNAYVDTMASEQLTSWTIEAWFRATTAATTAGPATTPLCRGENYAFVWDCISIQAYCRSAFLTAAGTFASTTLGPLGVATWHYAVATYNGSTLVTYVNGTQVGSSNVGGPAGNSAATAWIGRASPSPYPTGTFAGDVDEVRVSSEVRPAAYATLQHRSMIDSLVTYGPELPNPSEKLTP